MHRYRGSKDGCLKKQKIAIYHAPSKPTQTYEGTCKGMKRDVALCALLIPQYQASGLLAQESELNTE
jgi:hypothetical protein